MLARRLCAPALLTLCALTVSCTGSAEQNWSYEEPTGPEQWGALNEDYATCDDGAAQSPIDLPGTTPGAEGKRAEAELADTLPAGSTHDSGHAVEFSPEDDDIAELTYEDTDYALDHIHVHTPSEHTVDGEQLAAEFHLVHESETEELLVVGVLAEPGDGDPRLDAFTDAADQSTETPIEFPLDLLMPEEATLLSYEGSLTTPPCSEGVQWLVLQAPVELSEEQLTALETAHADNARPTQPLNDREISSGSAAADR